MVFASAVVLPIVALVALYCLVMGVRDRARLRRIEKRLGLHGDGRDGSS